MTTARNTYQQLIMAHEQPQPTGTNAGIVRAMSSTAEPDGAHTVTIKVIQELLIARGASIQADGILGPKTLQAILQALIE